MKNSLDIAFEEGREEGRDHRNNEIAREMLSEGESIQKIIKYTGLSEKKISEIITQQKN